MTGLPELPGQVEQLCKISSNPSLNMILPGAIRFLPAINLNTLFISQELSLKSGRGYPITTTSVSMCGSSVDNVNDGGGKLVSATKKAKSSRWSSSINNTSLIRYTSDLLLVCSCSTSILAV